MKTKFDLKKFEDLYDTFDKGHDRRHLEEVRTFALKLGKKYCPDELELVYVGATLHDVGLSITREPHEIEGYELIKNNIEFQNAYTKEEQKLILESIREHRASTGNPQSVVAKVVSDADKASAGTNRVFQRAYEWGVQNLPQINHPGQLLRAAYHLKVKYGENSYGTRLYFDESKQKQARTFKPIFEALKTYDLDKLESFLK